jgi:hypothetical protein
MDAWHVRERRNQASMAVEGILAEFLDKSGEIRKVESADRNELGEDVRVQH